MGLLFFLLSFLMFLSSLLEVHGWFLCMARSILLALFDKCWVLALLLWVFHE